MAARVPCLRCPLPRPGCQPTDFTFEIYSQTHYTNSSWWEVRADRSGHGAMEVHNAG